MSKENKNKLICVDIESDSLWHWVKSPICYDTILPSYKLYKKGYKIIENE